MVEHMRHHKVPSNVRLPKSSESGYGQHTEVILDGVQKIQAVATLVESAIIWRAQHIAWNVDIHTAEQLLFRLIYKEGSQNPQAMDLLARIYFQQSKYEKAKDLWNRASELQPANPALRRTSQLMQRIAKSPSSALFSYRISTLARGTLLLFFICVLGWGGVKGYNAFERWAEGPIAVQNLTGRFHYDYDSITKDIFYIPNELGVTTATANEDGAYSMGFTRKKAASGREIGRIEVVVERTGSSIKATGSIPNLYVRYLVEQALWDIPGVTDVDMRDLVVDRSYRVNKGDSLWIIAKRIYGEGSAWTTLARFNDLDNPSKLSIGQELRLPLGDETLVPER